MIHRDDIPYQELEKMEAELQRKHPGAKVVFLGDVPENEIPDEIKLKLKEAEKDSEDSVDFGYCLDCEASIEEIQDYHPMDPKWEPPPGWKCYADYAGRVIGWRCDVCQEVWAVANEINENERWTTTDRSPDDPFGFAENAGGHDEEKSDGDNFWDDLEEFDGK